MAISDAVAKASGNAVAPAPKSAPKKGSSKDNPFRDAFVANGAAIRENMSEDERAVEGSKSDKLEFVCSLGNPARSNKRKEGGENKPSHEVVGYKFIIHEDMQIPVSPLKETPAGPTDTGSISLTDGKAGETVVLNLIEAAALLSRAEFAGRATGGTRGVFLGATVQENTTSNPKPQIKWIGGNGSTKETMELIGDVTETGVVLKPGYEKFAPLFTKKKMSRKSAGAGAKKNDSVANLAAAFRNLYANR